MTVFRYDFNSPYAYLATERIEGLLPEARWEPIAFAFLLRAQGRTPWSFTESKAAGHFWGDDQLESAAAFAGSRGPRIRPAAP